MTHKVCSLCLIGKDNVSNGVGSWFLFSFKLVIIHQGLNPRKLHCWFQSLHFVWTNLFGFLWKTEKRGSTAQFNNGPVKKISTRGRFSGRYPFFTYPFCLAGRVFSHLCTLGRMDTCPRCVLGSLRFPGRKTLSADTAGKKFAQKGRRAGNRGWLCRGFYAIFKKMGREPPSERVSDREPVFDLERNGLSFSLETFLFIRLNMLICICILFPMPRHHIQSKTVSASACACSMDC